MVKASSISSTRSRSLYEETVGIDWAFAGHYAVGEEVGQTLSVASAFYDMEPAGLPALDEALFASYLPTRSTPPSVFSRVNTMSNRLNSLKGNCHRLETDAGWSGQIYGGVKT